MKKNQIIILSILLSILSLNAAKKTKVKAWVDPAKAEQEHPSFKLQGEYTGDGMALQASAMKDGKFLVATYKGGLPGDGWDKSDIKSEILDTEALKERVAKMKRVVRVSKTMGRKPPIGAEVYFFGLDNDTIKGKIEKGLLWAGAKTNVKVGSFEMHIEFRLPFKPDRNPSNQDRGNSGIYIFNNYECQVLDSFALDYNKPENNAIKTESLNKQWCGCFYKFKLADINMSYPPLQWQTYDITFTAAKFEDGKKIKSARITVLHNGVKIHDGVELPKGTGNGARRPEKEKDYIYFQNHANPVAYRNIWIKETK